MEWTTRVVPAEPFFCAASREVTESRRDVTESRRAAEEQAALRRVATQTPHAEVFALIAEEIGRLLAVDSIETVRYEDDRIAAVVAG